MSATNVQRHDQIQLLLVRIVRLTAPRHNFRLDLQLTAGAPANASIENLARLIDDNLLVLAVLTNVIFQGFELFAFKQRKDLAEWMERLFGVHGSLLLFRRAVSTGA